MALPQIRVWTRGQVFFLLVGRFFSKGTAWGNDLMLLMPAVHSLRLTDEEVLCFTSLPFSYWTVAILFPSHYLDLGKRDVFEKFIYMFKIMY